MLYCDASAWVKRYVQELGSPEVHTLFQRRERMGSSILGYVEVVAALSRRLSRNDLALSDERLTADWQSMAQAPLTDAVMNRAAELACEHKLRGADAAARASGLQVVNPTQP